MLNCLPVVNGAGCHSAHEMLPYTTAMGSIVEQRGFKHCLSFSAQSSHFSPLRWMYASNASLCAQRKLVGRASQSSQHSQQGKGRARKLSYPNGLLMADLLAWEV